MAEVTQRSLMDIEPRELTTLVKGLPTLPVVFQQLLEMMQDPQIQVPVVAEFISQDMSLTAKILKLVNSAFYGRPSQITTISRAVVIMGFQAVRSAVLAISIFEQFREQESIEGFAVADFWRHSLATACIAKSLSEELKVANPEDAFVVGLLHDVGKLVMLNHFTEDVATLCEASIENKLTWYGCEDALFGVDHTSIAASVFQAWNYPDPIVEALACHHRPRSASRHIELASLAHVADVTAYQVGAPCPGAEPMSVYDESALELLGFTPGDSEALLARAAESIEQSASILQLLD